MLIKEIWQMIKYTKKQQKFISELYGYDLDKFIQRMESLRDCGGYEKYDEEVNTIFQLSRELIRGTTTNAETLFNLAWRIQSEFQQKLDLLEQALELNNLAEDTRIESKDECDELYWVLDSLRILNNLHPDRILTWDEVTPTGCVIY